MNVRAGVLGFVMVCGNERLAIRSLLYLAILLRLDSCFWDTLVCLCCCVVLWSSPLNQAVAKPGSAGDGEVRVMLDDVGVLVLLYGAVVLTAAGCGRAWQWMRWRGPCDAAVLPVLCGTVVLTAAGCGQTWQWMRWRGPCDAAVLPVLCGTVVLTAAGCGQTWQWMRWRGPCDAAVLPVLCGTVVLTAAGCGQTWQWMRWRGRCDVAVLGS